MTNKKLNYLIAALFALIFSWQHASAESMQLYEKHLAKELGWQAQNPQKNFCAGTYNIPQYIKDNPIINKDAPIKITATGPEQFSLKGVTVLKNNIVITQSGRIIYADKIYIFRDRKKNKITKLVISGNVRIYQQKTLLITDKSIVTLYPRTVSVENMAYHYHSIASSAHSSKNSFDAWGVAKNADQDSEEVITLKKATFSTCSPISPTWKFSTSKLIIDQQKNKGQAYHAVLKVKNIPIFYFPYYVFQLNNERKSGFLSPTFGSISNAGFFFGTPYYFNLAPNYDWTLTPEFYGSRGFRGVSLFRYLTNSSKGNISASILPDDKTFGTFRQNSIITYSNTSIYPTATYAPYLSALSKEKNLRGIVNAENKSIFNSSWSSRFYINLVSDPYYLADITNSSPYDNSKTNQLLNLLQVQYSSQNWDTSGYIQSYQTLHLINQIQGQGQALDQYKRLPEFSAVGYYPILENLSFEIDNNYTNFDYYSQILPNKPEGSRFNIRPGLKLNLENSAAYVKPEFLLDETAYKLSNPTTGIKRSSQRTLPIVDIDSGLHFIRHFNLHENQYSQTLDPKLFYLYVPYKNQNSLPNFDTIELPFFFEQLYSLNAFQGLDRIENANQVSLGLSSNIIRDDSGSKILSANIGDIYYISQPKVCLFPGCSLIQRHFSPLVTDLSLYLNSAWSLNGSIAWDPKFDKTNNAGAGINYHGDGNSIININYLFVNANPTSISTFNPNQNTTPNAFMNNSSHLIVSFAWPVTERWGTIGYTDYNFQLHHLDTAYAGVQYDSCCWGVRFIIKRLFDSSALNNNGNVINSFGTNYFVEITLKGLGSFGPASTNFVKSIVPGYKP